MITDTVVQARISNITFILLLQNAALLLAQSYQSNRRVYFYFSFFFLNTWQKLRFLTALAFKEVHFHLSHVTGRTDWQKGGDQTKQCRKSVAQTTQIPAPIGTSEACLLEFLDSVPVIIKSSQISVDKMLDKR